ncbi:MAG: hypothetical protein JWN31_597 [Frankiales bacterium]|nr:hypothetical protein [Frankiales bacterium]
MLLHPARVSRHCATVALLACGALLLGGSPGHADNAPRPDSFGGDATASSFHYVIDRTPQPTPVTDAFHVEMPYATTSFDSSGTASATSSAFYPGAGPLGVPALLCQFAAQLCGPPFPAVPRYPLIASASYPTHQNDQADLSPGPQLIGPFAISPNVIVAHADQDRLEAMSELGGLGLTGQITADSATTHSKQSFEGGVLVVVSQATVTGLDLGGGLLHINALHSIATARVDGGSTTTSSATTTITGATAGGQPVTIDSTGVHLAGNGDGSALAKVNDALAALASQGIGVRLLSSTKDVAGHTADAVAGGLLLSFSHDLNLPTVPVTLPPSLPGIPGYNGTYFGSVTVGGAGVRAFATPAQDEVLPPIDLPGDPDPVVAPPVRVGTVQVPPSAPAGAGPTVPGPIQAGPARHGGSVLAADLTADRLQLLCLVLLGYPLMVLLGSLVTRRRRE